MIAVIDGRMPCSAKSRLKEICEVVELPPFSVLDPRVASHPDMLMQVLGGRLFVPEKFYAEAKKEIDTIVRKTTLSLALTSDLLGKEYPSDIAFNFFWLNNTIVGKLAHISAEIKEFAAAHGIACVNVNQGYAKCSTVVLNNAIITADRGIYNTASALGSDALLVSADGVVLDGYGCGFLGGASGVYENKVVFCGDITRHEDFDRISTFCAKHGYEVISLSSEPLYDVGTIIFI